MRGLRDDGVIAELDVANIDDPGPLVFADSAVRYGGVARKVPASESGIGGNAGGDGPAERVVAPVNVPLVGYYDAVGIVAVGADDRLDAGKQEEEGEDGDVEERSSSRRERHRINRATERSRMTSLADIVCREGKSVMKISSVRVQTMSGYLLC